MEITYRKCGDYMIPNLVIDPEPKEELTRYGRMRQKYLKEYRHGTYTAMLLGGTLKAHCLMIQEQAEERFDLLVQKMAKREGVTEQLKRQEQMIWVQKMNNIRARADEIVREEVIFG